jgi:hypothetical protein
MAHPLDVDDVVLNFDPARPDARFRAMGLPADILVASAALPDPAPWPGGSAPTPAPLPKPPAVTDDLSRFKGYDAVVVTWTAAEASAMATLFTIQGGRVLLFKSGLHLDYDGPQFPVRRLMSEIAQAVEPRVFITTGTGGGIGANVDNAFARARPRSPPTFNSAFAKV